MNRLLEGAWVGPATAIGEDYKVLEVRGVVKIKANGDRYEMKLLKKEVGQLALQVLTQGDASEQSLTNFPGAAVTQYGAPEDNRVITRKRQTALSKSATRELILAIRTGKA